VTQQVINWSYSSDQIRLKVPIGIPYEADVRQAIALCVESAGQVERVLKHPRRSATSKASATMRSTSSCASGSTIR
jgi:small-conductance mechanosensitive channel